MTLAQLCSAFVLVSLVIVLLPIKFSFILSGVFSLKVVTFSSNPFENVNEATRFSDHPFSIILLYRDILKSRNLAITSPLGSLHRRWMTPGP